MKGKLPLSALYCLTIGGLLLAVIWGSRAITVISENMPVERQHCIIIDAGHGGEDGGATSCTGKLESSFNLAISLRLNDLLHLLGYDTAMIRTSDVSIYTKGETIAQKKVSDLKERVRIANSMSIHQNTCSDSHYHGAQVFYAKTANSAELAKQLQSTFTSTINSSSNRQCKKADGIYLMEHVSCTGILVECGFLSNPEEEARLRSAEYQKKICCVIASSVSTYLSNT